MPDRCRSVTDTTHHFRPVSSATKSNRLSSGRSWEQCPHRSPFFAVTSYRARGRQEPASLGTRRYSGRHRGARPFSAPVAEQNERHPSSKRNDAGATPAGSIFSPMMSKEHARLLNGSSWCESTLGSFCRHPIAQEKSNRLTSGGPGSVTSSGDHFIPL